MRGANTKNRIIPIILTFFILLFATACGVKDEAGVFLRVQKGYSLEIEVENEYCLGVEKSADGYIGIIAHKLTAADGKRTYRIYTADTSKGEMCELFEVSGTNISNAFFNKEGNVVVYGTKGGTIYSKEGKVLNEFSTKNFFKQLIQTEAGDYYCIVSDYSEYELGKFDITTGAVTKLDCGLTRGMLANGCLCTVSNNVYVFCSEGLYKVDFKNSYVMLIHSTEGSTANIFKHMMPVVAIDMHNEDNMTAFHTDGFFETLEYINLSREREVLTLREGPFRNEKLKPFVFDMIDEYNSTNGRYYIRLEEFDDLLDTISAYENRTKAMMSSGEVDLLFINALGSDSMTGFKKKEFAELTSHFSSKGINPADYYSIAVYPFGTETSGLYGINLDCSGIQFFYDAAIGGDNKDITTEYLLKQLSESEKSVGVMYGSKPLDNLIMLLQISESFFGSINWENKKCDLNAGSFKQNAALIKDIALKNKEPENFPIAMRTNLSGMQNYISSTEAYEYDNYRMAKGVFFDDGEYPVHTNGDELVVCANSKHIIGATDFMTFLMSDYAQSVMPEYGLEIAKKDIDLEYAKRFLGSETVHNTLRTEYSVEGTKIAQESGIEAYLKYIAANKDKMERTITVSEEHIAEYMSLKDAIRCYPVRIQPLLVIVEEELAPYFEGAKTLDEACDILQNRINIYLNE